MWLAYRSDRIMNKSVGKKAAGISCQTKRILANSDQFYHTRKVVPSPTYDRAAIASTSEFTFIHPFHLLIEQSGRGRRGFFYVRV